MKTVGCQSLFCSEVLSNQASPPPALLQSLASAFCVEGQAGFESHAVDRTRGGERTRPGSHSEGKLKNEYLKYIYFFQSTSELHLFRRFFMSPAAS